MYEGVARQSDERLPSHTQAHWHESDNKFESCMFYGFCSLPSMHAAGNVQIMLSAWQLSVTTVHSPSQNLPVVQLLIIGSTDSSLINEVRHCPRAYALDSTHSPGSSDGLLAPTVFGHTPSWAQSHPPALFPTGNTQCLSMHEWVACKI